ncbi:hypothetical protein ACIRD3_07095 [Kitasatospora sp. NPDC093550]|uniref:hypothetical protein n=1 Tax=Kitasatospora sp. NPDC093550 TaxID=3364089 RepID=UPI0038028B95
MAEQIKMTVEGIEGFVSELVKLDESVSSQKNTWQDVHGAGIKPGRDVFSPAKTLKANFNAFSGSVISSLDFLWNEVDKISLDLLRARDRLHLGNGEALTEAQMMDIIGDVLNGGGPAKPPAA